jgi:hypothetical protein
MIFTSGFGLQLLLTELGFISGFQIRQRMSRYIFTTAAALIRLDGESYQATHKKRAG